MNDVSEMNKVQSAIYRYMYHNTIILSLHLSIIALTKGHNTEKIVLSGVVFSYIFHHHVPSHAESHPHQFGGRVSPEDLVNHRPILLCTTYKYQPMKFMFF